MKNVSPETLRPSSPNTTLSLNISLSTASFTSAQNNKTNLTLTPEIKSRQIMEPKSHTEPLSEAQNDEITPIYGTSSPVHANGCQISGIAASQAYPPEKKVHQINDKDPYQVTRDSRELLKHLKELPKISHTDYIGKELCTKCHKIVQESQQSISCDSCDRWTHRKCGGMTKKKFEHLSKIKFFNWHCENCREDDPLFDTIIQEVTQLDDLPEDTEIVRKNKNEILIIHMNCRSIIKKIEELVQLIESLNPDIICLTETWYDKSVPKGFQIPPGYKIIRKDRTEKFQNLHKKKGGGGVAILHKSQLNVTFKESLTDKTEDILWANVKAKQSFLLGVIYRPQYSLMLDDTLGESTLEKNIRKASEITSNIVVTGDFNIDMRKKEDNNTINLKNTFKSYCLKQWINKSTRFDRKTGKGSIIDHIWTTPEIKPKAIGTFIGLSDHLGTYIKINKNAILESPKSFIKYRDYKKYNVEDFLEELQEEIKQSTLRQLISTKQTNEAMEELVKILQKVANKHAPIRKVKRRFTKKKIPWMTEDLKDKITHKNELLTDYLTTGSEFLKKRLDQAQNIIKKTKYRQKATYVKTEMDNAGKDSASLWKMYNYLTGRNQQMDKIEPEYMTQEKANNFNDYFCTIGEKTAPPVQNQETEIRNKPQFEFSFKEESPENIKKIINGLKINTATGKDDIDMKLIKDANLIITPVLTDIINLGYETNTFPECMKSSIIVPIYKEGDINNIKNYRPIAILPAISKIIERSAVNQIISYLETNQLITKCQHAYRKQHGTITNLVEAINHIYREIDNKKYSAIVKMDLSKAFDCINHRILLNKLNNMGLKKDSLTWMASYLANRFQCTKFQNYTSTEGKSTSGVPQGSILGPLLFICYTNDFPEHLSNLSKVLSYADDTELLITASSKKELKEKIEAAIEQAQNWFKKNSMKLNSDKTEILVFNTHNDLENISFDVEHDNQMISLLPKKHIEILGILIDQDLNWTKQVNKVKRNSMNATRNIHRINHLLTREHRINMYNGVIKPNFDYGDILWGGCLEKDSQSLQRIQNFAVKSITGNRKYDSASQSFKELKFLNLQQRRKVHETVFLHKALLNKSSKNLHEEYTSYLPPIHTRRAEHRKLLVPSHNSAKFERSPLYRTIHTWNETPNFLPKDNPKTHKVRFQNYLVQKTYPP